MYLRSTAPASASCFLSRSIDPSFIGRRLGFLIYFETTPMPTMRAPGCVSKITIAPSVVLGVCDGYV